MNPMNKSSVSPLAFTARSAKQMTCKCTHAYGSGKRVHNPFKDGYRCTVCGDEKKTSAAS